MKKIIFTIICLTAQFSYSTDSSNCKSLGIYSTYQALDFDSMSEDEVQNIIEYVLNVANSDVFTDNNRVILPELVKSEVSVGLSVLSPQLNALTDAVGFAPLSVGLVITMFDQMVYSDKDTREFKFMINNMALNSSVSFQGTRILHGLGVYIENGCP